MWEISHSTCNPLESVYVKVKSRVTTDKAISKVQRRSKEKGDRNYEQHTETERKHT
jgi:hypothetical protein